MKEVLYKNLNLISIIINSDNFEVSSNIYLIQTNFLTISNTLNQNFFDNLIEEIFEIDKNGFHLRNIIQELNKMVMLLEEKKDSYNKYDDLNFLKDSFKIHCDTLYRNQLKIIEENDVDESILSKNDIESKIDAIIYNQDLHINYYKRFVRLFKKVEENYSRELFLIENKAKITLNYTNNYYLDPFIILQIVRLNKVYNLFNKSEFELLYNIFNLNSYTNELKVNENKKIKTSYLIKYLFDNIINELEKDIWKGEIIKYFDLKESTFKSKTSMDSDNKFHKNIIKLFKDEFMVYNEPLNT